MSDLELDLLLAAQHTYSQRQEDLWADAKIDGRAVFSVRESYKLHRGRLMEVQDDIERVRWLIQGALMGEGPSSEEPQKALLSRFFGGCPDVLSHVADSLGQLFDIVGFFLSWPVYKRRTGGDDFEGAQEERATEDPVDDSGVATGKIAGHRSSAGGPRSKGSEGRRRRKDGSQGSSCCDIHVPVPPENPKDDTHTSFPPTTPPRTRIPLPPEHFAPPAYRPRLRWLIRKRPLLPAEVAENEWDVVQVPERSQLVLHEGRVAHSGRRLRMHVSHHLADGVLVGSRLDAASVLAGGSTNAIGQEQPDHHVVPRRPAPSSVTVLCYGQTGTGKTYTMRELIPAAAKRLFSSFGEAEASDGVATVSRTPPALFFQAFEIIHKGVAHDLLDLRKTARIFEDSSRRAVVKSALIKCASEAEILKLFDAALALRRSEATERNPESSRSHAFFVLRAERSEIRIVDLAGSERNFETERMSAKQHRQSADINSSLMVLKACMRSLSAGAQERPGAPGPRVPFRESRLTHLLQDCFLPDSDAELLLISTISPCARDAIHSRNTLAHAGEMRWAMPSSTRGTRSSDREEKNVIASRSCVLDLPLSVFYTSDKAMEKWTEADVQNWLGSVAGGRFAKLVLPEGRRDGRGLLSLDSANLSVSDRFQTSVAGRICTAHVTVSHVGFAESMSAMSYVRSAESCWICGVSCRMHSNLKVWSVFRTETGPLMFGLCVSSSGRGLLSLDSANFAELFETGLLRAARANDEGASWNIVGPDRAARVGMLFWGLVQAAKSASNVLMLAGDVVVDGGGSAGGSTSGERGSPAEEGRNAAGGEREVVRLNDLD